MLTFPFAYRKFGGFTYPVLSDPSEIKSYLMKWILRGVSIEPLLVNQNGFERMNGYTRDTVLKRYEQKEVYAYLGSTGVQSLPTLALPK
jgi:hypothetical protein